MKPSQVGGEVVGEVGEGELDLGLFETRLLLDRARKGDLDERRCGDGL